MTTPTILPAGYDGTDKDYLRAKADREGSLRIQYSTVTVPATTAADIVIGVVPFQRGFRLANNATRLAVADLDTATNVLLNVGYVYRTGSTETDDPDAFATLLTIAQTGGYITFDEPTNGLPWVATDDGWIACQISAAPTTTSGAIFGQVIGAYDGLGAVN